ncbi:MAG TPA: sugar phosphate isomerase/epimerase family protein [Phycisphaerales bacterium]|nr:sugar phosphate isomerase/epimerase family protein [Phycisphaerales bacterium]
MARLGVCSWSLRPSSPADLAARVRECGVGAVQLALDPVRSGAWDEGETRGVLGANGIGILSGMMAMEDEDYSTLDTIRATGGVRPDATWPANLAAARANAALAERLGLGLVTFHAGFLPHDHADPERARMIRRLRELIEVFGERGVRVAFETGQESAGTLLDVLAELPESAGVNFDPANMILYGMGDPVAALRQLAGRVVQIHVKDALPAETPGAWGTEVVAGSGAVRWEELFAARGEAGLSCDLVVEREAGDSRIPDVRTAAALVRRSAPVDA